MDTNKQLNTKKKHPHKIFSMRVMFLATVILAMLAVTVFIGGLSIYEVDNYIMEQAKEFVSVSCANEAAKINSSLANMEKSVKIMESYLMDFFESEEAVTDRALQEKVIKSAEEMFSDVIKHTSTGGAISYYFRLDPTLSDTKTGLFYSKTKDKNEFVRFEPTDLAAYDKEDTEHVGWYWQPYEAGGPIWMKPYHNQNNDILMISYVIPMYIGEKFIGIVGMDFDYMVLSDRVHEITVYENGFAHLEIDGDVICSDEYSAAHDSGEGNKYLRASSDLVNGMTLILNADYDDIRQIRYDISLDILYVVLVLFAVFSVIAVLAVQKIVDPLKKLTEASVEFSDGNYDVDIVKSDTYEIRLLSTAFENMAKHLREREELLRLSANRDSLTGLRNTTAYMSWVSEFDKEIVNKNTEFGLAVIDLNSLKKANDEHGHGVGNDLIVASSKVIADTFKRSPVFRIGGDEFLVVLRDEDLADREKLFLQFDRQCKESFIEDNGVKIPVSLAIGYALFDPNKDRCVEDVFKRADDAMYENKRRSKAEIS